jgi:hypothetical protein
MLGLNHHSAFNSQFYPAVGKRTIATLRVVSPFRSTFLHFLVQAITKSQTIKRKSTQVWSSRKGCLGLWLISTLLNLLNYAAISLLDWFIMWYTLLLLWTIPICYKMPLQSHFLTHKLIFINIFTCRCIFQMLLHITNVLRRGVMFYQLALYLLRQRLVKNGSMHLIWWFMLVRLRLAVLCPFEELKSLFELGNVQSLVCIKVADLECFW